MRKHSPILALTAVAAILVAPAFIAPAFADDAPSTSSNTSYDAKDNGGYVAKDKTESTDANGTVTKHTTTKKVKVDNNGNKETTVDIKSSTDPKGLFNKSTNETKNTATVKDGEAKYTHKKTVDGKTVEDTTEQTAPQ